MAQVRTATHMTTPIAARDQGDEGCCLSETDGIAECQAVVSDVILPHLRECGCSRVS